jgi:hypothetical protein
MGFLSEKIEQADQAPAAADERRQIAADFFQIAVLKTITSQGSATRTCPARRRDQTAGHDSRAAVRFAKQAKRSRRQAGDRTGVDAPPAAP